MNFSPTKVISRVNGLNFPLNNKRHSLNMTDELEIKEDLVEDNQICKLCFKKAATYTCPRCHMRYCSSDCYKCEAHAQCSEAFYKGCFMEELKDIQNQPRGKEKMLEMLKRFEEESKDGDYDEDDLAERFEGVNLDETEQVWQLLTQSERREFEKSIQEGQLGNMIEIWDPWWSQRVLVEEVRADGQSNQKRCPPVIDPIPDFSNLYKGEPSANLKHSVLNVLFSYATMCRLFNGDHHELQDVSVTSFLEVACSLGRHSFESATDSLTTSMNLAKDSAKSLAVSNEFVIGILQDIIKIIQGPGVDQLVWIKSALSDSYTLVKTAQKLISKQCKQNAADSADAMKLKKHQLFQACKKLEFFLSWTVKYGHELLPLVSEIDFVSCAESTKLVKMSSETEKRQSVRKETKAVTLVEEI